MKQSGLNYGFNDRPKGSVTLVSALQWLIFIMLNNVFIPIVVANLYGLSARETAELVQRTIFVVGVASLMQVFWGHRLPIVEGVAGLWWSIFILVSENAKALGVDPRSLLPSLEGGLIIAGLFMVSVSLTPFFGRVKGLFTPVVTGTYLILLALQMSVSFLGKLMGAEKGAFDGKLFIVSLVTIAVTLVLSYKGKGAAKSFAALGGIGAGWIAYILLGIRPDTEPLPPLEGVFSLPQPFPWGFPRWDSGVIVASVITSLVLLSNLFASIDVLSSLQAGQVDPASGRRGGIFNGIGDILAGVFSTIGTTPFSIVVGFIHITGNAARIPFIIASFLMAIAGLLSPVGRLFTQIPVVLGTR